MKNTLMCALALALAGIAGARADEGRIPIFGPATITQSGHFILTRDIAAPGASDGITIQADNVTLDLGGHLVTASTGVGITIVDGFHDITVRNGRLTGGVHAVAYSSTTVGVRLELKSLEISNTTNQSIFIDGAEYVEIRSCRVVSPGWADLDIRAVSGGDTFVGRFVGNTIDGAGGGNLPGILLSDLRGGEVRGNVVTAVQALGGGITIGDAVPATPQDGGNLIEDNAVSGGPAGASGVTVATSHNLVLNNVVHGMPASGLILSSSGAGNLLAENVSSGCAGDGIHALGALRSLIENTLLEGNTGTGCGILFGSPGANAYRNNMLRNNAGGAVCLPAGNLDAGGNIP